MKILLVSHRFPPAHRAGTELYTAELGARLAERGHEVVVFTTDKDVGREDLSLREYRHRGLRVVELVNDLYLDGFRETWDRPAVVQRFAALLDELRPDVVHFQHLMYLSVGCLEAARRCGAAVLFTLHDFWLECPRLGQLLHADGTRCDAVDFARCGTCLPSHPWRQSRAARAAGRALARVRGLTGVDLAPLARGAARAVAGGRRAAPWRPPEADEARRYAEAARERDGELRTRVVAAVHRYLSPSRFLRERLVAWGLPAERVVHLATGVDRAAFAAPAERTPERAGRLRVTYLGSLVPAKGAHVLLEAWGRMAAASRASASLRLFGPGEHAPAYVAELEERARATGASLGGALEREQVARALAQTDLLVVPSVWFENRPLVVLEALAARVPCLVSDLGGMAELVEPGVSGWRFPAGDAGALAERLEALIADRSPLEALTFDVERHLPGWEAFTDAVLEQYALARAEAAA